MNVMQQQTRTSPLPVFALLAAALLVAGCSSTVPKGSSGVPRVMGDVRVSPVTPISRQGEENSRPLAGARIAFTRESGEAVGSAISDSSGRFGIELAAGRYIATPSPFEGTPYPRPPAAETLVVTDGATAHLSFMYDSGIR